MSLALPINEDQRDCLQELTNVAMGAAAESLANFTGTFVNLPIPKIVCIDSAHFIDSLGQIEGYESLSSISQLFKISGLDCYAMIVINDESISDLARFTGRSLLSEGEETAGGAVAGQVVNDDKVKTLLHDLCNTINKTCLDRFGEMIEGKLEAEPPKINDLHVPLESIHIDSLSNSEKLLSVEINYHIENQPFNCDLLLLFPEDSLDELMNVLDELM